ncbi:DUF4245 domain-containing protein [Hamadaea sp. NPDC051192]|uniref:DUF4245 domain-containing protein n=1 Tax=Hamadaea sp. NPDC051192 TaxID=3154940 RepID=UPI003421B2EE
MTSSPATDSAQDEVTQTAADAGKRVRRPRDMALSLAVLFVPILLVLGVGRFLYGDSTTATVDPAVALSSAARASMSPIPQGQVPDGWKVVSAAYRDGVLRLGYLTEADKGVQLVQGSGDPATFVRTELSASAKQDGAMEIAGADWQRWTGRPGESALVRSTGAVTVIVVGPVGEADLVKLVTAARA